MLEFVDKIVRNVPAAVKDTRQRCKGDTEVFHNENGILLVSYTGTKEQSQFS